jgi:hypothetical protein
MAETLSFGQIVHAHVVDMALANAIPSHGFVLPEIASAATGVTDETKGYS